MRSGHREIIKHAIGTRSASEPTLFGQIYDLVAASRMGVVQQTVPVGQADRSGRCLGGLVASGLLHGVRLRQARASGDYHGGDRCRSASRPRLAVARDVGPRKHPSHTRRYKELKGRDVTWPLPD